MYNPCKISHETYKSRLRPMRNVCTTYAQNVENPCTIRVQSEYNPRVVHVQSTCNRSATHLQFVCILCTIRTQYVAWNRFAPQYNSVYHITWHYKQFINSQWYGETHLIVIGKHNFEQFETDGDEKRTATTGIGPVFPCSYLKICILISNFWFINNKWKSWITLIFVECRSDRLARKLPKT